MNNYPEWWNQTITVYNKYEHKETGVILWYKTILDNCFWQVNDNKIVINETVLHTNSIICRIPVNTKFKEKYEWEELLSPQREDYFTLGTGDIVLKGKVEDNIDEYTKGKRSSDLLNKYKKLQGCMIIDSCSINVGGGRGSEHYYIRGV